MDAPKGSTIKKIQKDSTLLNKLMNIIINRDERNHSIVLNGGEVKVVRLSTIKKDTDTE